MESGLNPSDPTTARQTTKKKGFVGDFGDIAIDPMCKPNPTHHVLGNA
jgi:hypothetical protein